MIRSRGDRGESGGREQEEGDGGGGVCVCMGGGHRKS